MSEWRDISDAELRARLYNRRVASPSPDVLVARRDEPEVAAIIDKLLEGAK